MLTTIGGGGRHLNRQVLTWVVAFLLFGAAFVAAEYLCGGCYHMPTPGLQR